MGKFYIRFAIGIGQYPVLVVKILGKFHIDAALVPLTVVCIFYWKMELGCELK